MKKVNWSLGAQTLVLLGAVARTWSLVRQVRDPGMAWPPAGAAPPQLPPVTVIIPARNEEKNIARCAESLLAQDYPDYEVVVVNDGSTDATGQILERLQVLYPRLKVVTLSGQLPPGWAGKPHAMHCGYEAARAESEWILFSDADTFHRPPALRTAVSGAIQEKADLLSIMPYLELKTFWELVLMPVAIMGILVQYPPDQVNRPDSKLALANGQFLLLRRSAYERVNGYSGKLKNSLIDDRDMALAVKGSGGKLVLKNGRELVSVRMYTSLGEVWRGFRKNAFVGSRSSYLSVPFFVVMGLWLGVMPFGQLFYGLVRLIGGGGERVRSLLFCSFLQVILSMETRRRIDREMEVPLRYAVCAPLANLIFTGILLDSMLRSLTGQGVSWKDRTYAGAARTQQLIK